MIRPPSKNTTPMVGNTIVATSVLGHASRCAYTKSMPIFEATRTQICIAYQATHDVCVVVEHALICEFVLPFESTVLAIRQYWQFGSIGYMLTGTGLELRDDICH
ncbi:hypothetical protein ACHAW6_004906 [Cyclotella cf. meneghiniana]